jgi:hypothetical protein
LLQTLSNLKKKKIVQLVLTSSVKRSQFWSLKKRGVIVSIISWAHFNSCYTTYTIILTWKE